MGRGIAALLIVSLAVNVFLGGFVVGRIVAEGSSTELSEASVSGPPGPPRDRGFGDPMLRNMSVLSPEAQASFRSAFRGNRRELMGRRRMRGELRRNLADIIAADEWNREKAEAAFLALNEAESEHKAVQFKLLLDALSSLSAEDRKALVEAREHELLRPRPRRPR